MLDARDARDKAKSLEAEKPSEIDKDAGCALGKLCDESVRSMRGWQPVQIGRLWREIVKGLAEFFVRSRPR